MSTEVKVDSLPRCDLCKVHGRADIKVAAVDGKTTMGPWAYMCEEHFTEYGLGFGTGFGQRLILK